MKKPPIHTNGTLLQMTKDLYGHSFEIGTTVEIIKYNHIDEDYSVVDVDKPNEHTMRVTDEEFVLIF